MSGVLWDLLALIYIKAYGLIPRDIVPSCIACLGMRVLVLSSYGTGWGIFRSHMTLAVVSRGVPINAFRGWCCRYILFG
jgi:hypothetical protein